jgi:cation diffusion facilitator family transporter
VASPAILTTGHWQLTTALSEKVQVAATSALMGGTLALLKLAIGFFTGSLALISEGFHSSLDFFVTLVTWFSVKTADVPADEQHHYGHGKMENLSAFAEAILLVLTGFWILWESYEHLAQGVKMKETPGLWAAIGVLAVSILVDLSRSRALYKAAKKFHSQALEADALHFGTELLSSTVVLLGLLTMKLGGEPFSWTDPAAAICVAAVMIFTAMRLGRRAADVLVDRAPEGLEAQMQELIRDVPGVRDVGRIRARQSGGSTFVDATITVDPAIDMAQGHQISDNVELRVTEKFPKLDIVVHVEPGTPAEDHTGAVRELAEGMKMQLHAVRIRDIDGRLYVNFHAEFPPEMTLAAAHTLVSELERRIRRRLPGVAEIDSHMEPLGAEE